MLVEESSKSTHSISKVRIFLGSEEILAGSFKALFEG